ncbi:MAG: hypothetical protein U9N80_02120 [Chloroflexota bacterium]|nr:hypothetical protein [Chloroflexota bacterium]
MKPNELIVWGWLQGYVIRSIWSKGLTDTRESHRLLGPLVEK